MASLEGVHGVIIPVPVSVMEKAGTYRFVLHFYDDYGDSYRNHQVKAALEVNTSAESLIFNVLTDPDGDSQQGQSGYYVGKRDNLKFYVIIKAKIQWSGKPPFETIRFLLKRTKTGERWAKTGYLVTDPNDPDGPKDLEGGVKVWTFRTHKNAQERGVKDWIVTGSKGRLEISVSPPHKSNIAKFKINKRMQIVIVARTWIGATSTELGSSMCNRFVTKVYNFVGISLPTDLQTQYDTTLPDTEQGCLIFYASPGAWPNWNPAHVGIQQDEMYVIDINCILGHLNVQQHNQTELENKYPDSVKKSPKELQDLDGE